jgi:5'-deoxynucleotidase YfbR-like HD superfamily hydrolase
MNHVLTYTGRRVSLAAPDPASIDIRDIACSLSRLNRFCGATRLPVNVADHSLNVARFLAMKKASPSVQMLGLLHDAHEAYLGDIVHPVRREIAAYASFDLVTRIADRLDVAIMNAFGFGLLESSGDEAWVRAADAAVFAAEWRDLMQGPCPIVIEAAPFAIKPRNSEKSEEDFLRSFERLRIEVGPMPAFAVGGGK